MINFISGIVFTLGAFALLVTLYGWPVQRLVVKDTEFITIEWHYTPDAMHKDDDIGVVRLNQEMVEALI
jgi:hypothetical protein